MLRDLMERVDPLLAPSSLFSCLSLVMEVSRVNRYVETVRELELRLHDRRPC